LVRAPREAVHVGGKLAREVRSADDEFVGKDGWRRRPAMLLDPVAGRRQRALLDRRRPEQPDEDVEPVGRRQNLAGEVLADDPPGPAGLGGEFSVGQLGLAPPPRVATAELAQEPGQFAHGADLRHIDPNICVTAHRPKSSATARYLDQPIRQIAPPVQLRVTPVVRPPMSWRSATA
jgi:hypothetical protein